MRYVREDRILDELCERLCDEFQCWKMACAGDGYDCDFYPTDASCDNYLRAKVVAEAMEAAEEAISEALRNV